MKKMLALCVCMGIGYFSFAQDVTIVNNTSRTAGRIALGAEDGTGNAGMIPNLFINPSSTFGPVNVSALRQAQVGGPLIPNMYVVEAENNAGGACQDWQVWLANPNWAAGAGCGTSPIPASVTYSIDASKNVTLTIN